MVELGCSTGDGWPAASWRDVLRAQGVCAVVLESPYYGARRPAAQKGSKLLRVSDLLALGWVSFGCCVCGRGCAVSLRQSTSRCEEQVRAGKGDTHAVPCSVQATIYESLNLLHWLEKEGYSEGGLGALPRLCLAHLAHTTAPPTT